MSATGAAALRGASAARDYLTLSKYRLSGLVAFTAGVGYVARADAPRDGDRVAYWRAAAAATAGTWLAAAAANTLNQIYEVRSDALMARTRLRPLPAGRVGLAHAAAFALATGVSGVALLSVETNDTAAAIAAANVALYAGVYTPLKPVSTINTWVGAVVGALPPMLGWAAASGGELFGERERGAWALGSLLFLWQIPHFHALAVVSRADYAAAGLRMLAVTNPASNAQWARITAAAMIPLGVAFTATGVTTPAFAWEAAALGMWMYRGAAHMATAPTAVAAARPLFRASIFHLPITLSLILAHRAAPGAATSELQQPAAAVGDSANLLAKEIRFHQPWEMIAPFPFLPVPCGAPAVVFEVQERR